MKKGREVFQREVNRKSEIYYKYPGIYIKKKGISKEDYEKLREKLISELKLIVDTSNNEKVFQLVEKREAIYSGNHLSPLPDVVALPNYNFDIIFTYDSYKLFDDITLPIKIPRVRPTAICNKAIGGVCLFLI